jgi:hypothetical protein
MKKFLLILLITGFSITALANKPRPYIKSGNKKIYCEKIIDGVLKMKAYLPGDITPTIFQYSMVDAYFNNGKLYQKVSIQEENINEAFMEVKEKRGSLSLVCYEDYSDMHLSTDLTVKMPRKRLFLFDNSVFLCEVSQDVAEELCAYFSE